MAVSPSNHGYSVMITDFSYSYPRGPTVLENINLRVKKGTLLGIIGPNAAGKSTLCKTMNGLIPHFYGGKFKGKLMVGGLNTLESTVAELSTKIGFLFQNPEDQLSGMCTRADEEVSFGLSMFGFPKEQMRERVEEALKKVGLKGSEERNPFDLSGGEQQRLAIATLLAVRPEIIVMDEPTAQLDPIGKSKVLGVIRLLKQESKTVIVVEHEIEELASFADRIVLLDKGRIVLDDGTYEVLSNVEALKRVGIDPPSVTELGYIMRKRGKFTYDRYPITTSTAIDTFADLLRLRVDKRQ